MPGDKETFVRLWQVVRPHWRLCLSATIVTQLLNALRSVQPLFTRYAIDWHVIPKTTDGLFWLASAFIALRFITFLLFYYQRVLLSTLHQKIVRNLQVQLNKRLYAAHSSYFEGTPKGKIAAHFTMDVESVAGTATTFVSQVIGDAVLVVSTIATMLVIDRYLTFLLAIAILPIIPLLRYCRHHLQRAQADLKEKLAALNAFLQEYLAGILTIQVFNAEQRALREFETTNDSLRRAFNRSKLRQVGVTVTVELITVLILAGLVAFGGWQLIPHHGAQGVITIGAFVAFVQGLMQLIEPMRDISNSFGVIQDGMVSMKRVLGLLERSETLVSPTRGRRLGGVKGLVEFENVSFAYRGEDWVLKDLSLRIEPGESVAIVGQTGAGKTTIANLLLRFYDAQRGRIRLDGVDIRELDLESLRRSYAVTLQDAFLFQDTIKGNILLDNVEICDEKLKDLAARANSAGFIEKLPERYETVVGQGCGNLSLGQKQLIALTRAICRKPSIFILDEICSSVDAEMETLINNTIRSMIKERTSILISHRLSMIRHVDRIILLHKGRISEEGSHDQLIARGGLYWQLYQTWL